MRRLYKIGEFSKITGLTVKALRYYDSEGLLVPTGRGENDYRLYNEQNFDRAKLISLLRRFDFSIAEIKDVLENITDDGDIGCYLEEKRAQIHTEIAKKQKMLRTIDRQIKNYYSEVKKMEYGFEVKTIQEVSVISVRYKGAYSDVGKYIGTLFRAAKDKVCGPSFNLYYDNDCREEADIEICLPVSGVVSAEGVTYKTLPAVKALTTTHIGSYETISQAYKAALDYAHVNNMNLTIPTREVYIKGPGMMFKGNPDKYETEIVLPVE